MNSWRNPFCNFRPKIWTIEKPVFRVLSESDVDSIAPESGWSSSKWRILGERGSNLEMSNVGKYFTASHLRHVTPVAFSENQIYPLPRKKANFSPLR
jgi:hypothetical protein